MRNNIRFYIGLMIFGFVISGAFAQSASVIPSRFLPGDAVISGAASDQTAPVIAAGGNTMLAVWSDKRSYPAGASYYEFETAHDIYAMRLDASGNPIDTVPFVITQEAASQDNPQVVWNGTNWLVLFESYDLSGTGYYYQRSLEAVRVSPTGQVLDLAPIKIRGVSPPAWLGPPPATEPTGSSCSRRATPPARFHSSASRPLESLCSLRGRSSPQPTTRGLIFASSMPRACIFSPGPISMTPLPCGSTRTLTRSMQPRSL